MSALVQRTVKARCEGTPPAAIGERAPRASKACASTTYRPFGRRRVNRRRQCIVPVAFSQTGFAHALALIRVSADRVVRTQRQPLVPPVAIATSTRVIALPPVARNPRPPVDFRGAIVPLAPVAVARETSGAASVELYTTKLGDVALLFWGAGSYASVGATLTSVV